MSQNVHSVLSDLNRLYELSAEQIDSYRDKGYILLRSVASREVIDTVRPAIDRVLADFVAKRDAQGRVDDYGRFFQQVTNIWRLDEIARAFVFAQRFAGIAAGLMRVRGVRLYHDQALYKPAGGKITPWHQDQFYWPLDTRHTITMWMPLVDLTKEMGTMLFAGGSHRDGPILGRSISDDTHRAFDEIVNEKGWTIESYDLQAGDATFHSGWTVHSAHPNKGDQMRKVMTIIYFPDGTNVSEPENEYRQADLDAFLPGCKPGDAAATMLNPLLYSSSR
jgi:ectoine hydroxylase-related dioxygenase (phytanoyl-CoA dioxygenase family)